MEKNTITPAMQEVIRIQSRLWEIHHDLYRLPNFTESECKNENVCRHIEELQKHIDNAAGRAASLVMALRLVK